MKRGQNTQDYHISEVYIKIVFDFVAALRILDTTMFWRLFTVVLVCKQAPAAGIFVVKQGRLMGSNYSTNRMTCGR